LIGKRLISPQNPAGMVVEQVLVGELVDIASEIYVSVLPDRAAGKNLVMLCAEGGMEIEELAATRPEKIIRRHIDPAWGMEDFELREMVEAAGIPGPQQRAMVGLIRGLIRAFEKVDADMIEINPCAVTPEGKIVAADAKVSIDENALFRHPEYRETATDSAEDPLEAEAMEKGIAYVRLGGEIGIIGNGAGLVMCSLDEVSRAGGKAANFCDVGGGASAEKVKACMEVVLKDPNVKGLLINIFGGITRGDLVAEGILTAYNSLDIRVPVVARIDGTDAAAGLKKLEGSKVIGAATMQEAAAKIVEITR
ncbi:MAG: succinate--CoA ligase subunit beta, partial [Fimbriimonadaceae bacterium]|nr:succinate--CoA ligase subunit beta [Fimbriimonadaceae bacterium]